MKTTVGLVFTAVCLQLILVSAIFAQGVAEEVRALRQHLNVADDVEITMAQSSQINKSGSLKLYLAFGLDTGVRDNFLQWINKWNRGDGKRLGLLEVVSDFSQADVVLARYTVPAEATTSTTGVLLGNSSSVIGRTGSYQTLPAYAYVLARSFSSIRILSRYTGTTTPQETSRSGEQLWKDFESILKARGKAKK